jgi:hypothetical protein
MASQNAGCTSCAVQAKFQNLLGGLNSKECEGYEGGFISRMLQHSDLESMKNGLRLEKTCHPVFLKSPTVKLCFWSTYDNEMLVIALCLATLTFPGRVRCLLFCAQEVLVTQLLCMCSMSTTTA